MALACVAVGPVQAAERRSFVIPPADGYGIGDCLSGGGECGRVVADSWCESHGSTSAITFGSADDLTAAIVGRNGQPESIEHGSYVIDCAG